MENYLYGASIQGIQDYIFRTGKLSEVSGASELIEFFCQAMLEEIPGINKDAFDLIQNASGNIRCVFPAQQENDLALLVRYLPQLLSRKAPGLSISQAFVRYNEGEELPFDALEKKLKTQRNKVEFTKTQAWMSLARAPKTGGPAVHNKYNDELIDHETLSKYEKRFSDTLIAKIAGSAVGNFSRDNWPMDIKEITKSRQRSKGGSNSWIAVIHADGNGLGKIIQNSGAELRKDKKRFKTFSKAIDEATKQAAQCAFSEVVVPILDEINATAPNKYKIPFRPVLLGGDDLTVIIRADLAFDFSRKFMRYFEQFSSEKLSALKIDGIDGLTICAGIAYIKDSYPLHYGMHLAEMLCQDAKKEVKKNGSASALAFYKVQESFIISLEELKERTLKSKTFDYYAGPYFLKDIATDDQSFVKKLNYLKGIADEKEFSKGVGKLRQIVTESYKDQNSTKLMLERLSVINEAFYKKLELNKEVVGSKSQIMDLITLNSFLHGSK
jgi:CRISPR/Cas system-associated protein Cas10 (large subunit of type III CRISPR-Cas system)